MDKKFIYIIIGTLAILLILIISIIFITTSPVNLIKNPNNDKIISPFIVPNTQTLFYFDGNYTLKKWNLATNQVEDWIKFPFTNSDMISYSPDGTKAIAYWRDPNADSDAHRAWLIDLTNKKIIKEISQNIFTNAWSPDSQKIAYLTYNQTLEQFEIAVASPTNTDARRVVSLGSNHNYQEVLWPNDQSLVYFATPEEAAPVDITTVDLATLQTKKILSQVYVEGASVANDQNKILVNLLDPTSNIATLKIYDLASGQSQAVGKNNLFLSKITQIDNTDSFYAGWRQGNDTSDSLIKFDLNGNVQTIRKNLPGKIDIENLMLSNGNKLYFLGNDQLYQMKINL